MGEKIIHTNYNGTRSIEDIEKYDIILQYAFSTRKFDTEQNAEITKINNGVEIKIESIGEKEPPAFAISKNEETGVIEELLLPNRAYFQFPASGSIGSKTIYKIGVVTLILGIFLLIIRNKNLIKNKK